MLEELQLHEDQEKCIYFPYFIYEKGVLWLCHFIPKSLGKFCSSGQSSQGKNEENVTLYLPFLLEEELGVASQGCWRGGCFYLLPFVFLCCISENPVPRGVLLIRAAPRAFLRCFSSRGIGECLGFTFLGFAEQSWGCSSRDGASCSLLTFVGRPGPVGLLGKPRWRCV